MEYDRKELRSVTVAKLEALSIAGPKAVCASRYGDAHQAFGIFMARAAGRADHAAVGGGCTHFRISGMFCFPTVLR